MATIVPEVPNKALEAKAEAAAAGNSVPLLRAAVEKLADVVDDLLKASS